MFNELKTSFHSFFLTCFPPICSVCHANSAYVCGDCISQVRFSLQKQYSPLYLHYFFSDYSAVLKTIFHAIKFESCRRYIDVLREHFVKSVNLVPLVSQYDGWVAVPYHHDRLYQRGYDVLDLFYSPIFEAATLPKWDVLKRVKNTPALHRLDPDQRQHALRHCFKAKHEFYELVKGKRILLVDDISTTQTTVSECVRLLYESYDLRSVDCLTLVKVSEDKA